jgi:hypothetical protein
MHRRPSLAKVVTLALIACLLTYLMGVQSVLAAPVTLADDPVLTWNTFLGTGGAYAIAVDSSGNVYVTGSSASDAFVAKLTANGSLLWRIPLGGAGTDESRAITLDGSGSVYIVGTSNATWGSPIRAFTVNGTRRDAFVARLDSDGNLIWHTFLGGTGNDYGYGVAVSGSAVYAVGYSGATWETPLQAFAGGTDAFAAQLDTSGNLVWNTFLGGTDYEYGYATTADGTGVYVEWNGPTDGPTNTTITKLDSTGSLAWQNALGGYGRGVAVAGSGNVYVVGYSSAPWGTPIRSFTTDGTTWDAYAVALDSSGNLTWNTFLGTQGDDAGWDIALDGAENVYVVGDSANAWESPVRAFSGGQEGFAAKLNSNGTLIWNAFLGGAGNDASYAIAVDTATNIHVAGFGNATWGSPILPHTGGANMFVAKTHVLNGIWTGGGADNNWSTANNWSNLTIPGTADSVGFGNNTYKGANLNMGATVSGMTINGYTGTINLGSDSLTVSGNFSQTSGFLSGSSGALAVNGTLELVSGTLVAPSDNRLSLAGNFVHTGGQYQQTRDVSGNGDVGFPKSGGLLMNANGLGDLGTTRVVIRAGVDCTSSAGETVKHCYDIMPANTSGISATVTFYFNTGEVVGSNTCGTLEAWDWNAGWGSTLTLDTNYGVDGRMCGSDPQSVRVKGIESFSPFALKSGSAPTVVQLTDLRAHSEQNGRLVYCIVILLMGMAALAVRAFAYPPKLKRKV